MPRTPLPAHTVSCGFAAKRGAAPFCTEVAAARQDWRGVRAVSRKRPLESWTPMEAPTGGHVILFSQIKDCANIIESFVSHYAALGLQKLLLYLDDPRDGARHVLEESGWIEAGFVELVERSVELQTSWQSMPSWERVGSHAEAEVQSRQILNNEHALRRAKSLGADWLIHLDCDELLCLPEPAPTFFAKLASRQVTMYIFRNVEGVACAADSTDVLRTVRLFRENFGHIPRNPAAGLAMFDWQLKLGGYFISYENGKCAVNVHHAVKCLSVCMWEVKPQIKTGTRSMPDGSTCTWYTNNKRLWESAVKHRKDGKMHPDEEVPNFEECSGAVILHFCVCDFASFWRKRWTQLGYLSASDQFRVRASSGAMMARFYRLQREGRQAEARQLYQTMCVCDAQTAAKQMEAGVVIHVDPTKPGGPSGLSWVPARRQIRYADLAARAESRGAHFDAWAFFGKAIEGTIENGSPIAETHLRRAVCALHAGLEACVTFDAQQAFHLGNTMACVPHAKALQRLGLVTEALDVIEHGVQSLISTTSGACQSVRTELITLRDQISESSQSCAPSKQVTQKLPTVKDLQDAVAKAVKPDDRNSILFRAVLTIGMGWWQETNGQEPQFTNALFRAATTARSELAAVESSVRPRPITQVRKVWDKQEDALKRCGAFAGDLEPMPDLWLQLARICTALLQDRESIAISGCHQENQPMYCIWPLFAGLAAEVRRVFSIQLLNVLSEVRLSRIVHAGTSNGPEVDNGGLLPDNRREVSFRIFVPVDGSCPGPPGTLVLGTRDGEKSASFELCAGRLFLWWSRQTFHQVVGGEGYFSIACWGVVAQKGDSMHRENDPSRCF